MATRKLGNTDLQVCPLCLGGNSFGWTTDEAASQAVLNAYADMEGNFIDTADVYSNWVPGHKGGESEEIIGRWMKSKGNRSNMVIVTKVGSRMGPGPNDTGLSRKHIMKGVEDSLRRLQTDYIDLYLAHRDDPDAPQEETLAAFNDLVQQGKVRYIGASNYDAGRLQSALDVSKQHGFASFVCLQPRYNLVAREDYEGDLEELCRRENLGVITYSSLASGFLSGKYKRGQEVPKSQRAGSVQQRYMNDQGFSALNALEHVATEHGATDSQVALAWILARTGITAPIASATSPEQVHELMGAIDLRLSSDDIAMLDEAK